MAKTFFSSVTCGIAVLKDLSGTNHCKEQVLWCKSCRSVGVSMLQCLSLAFRLPDKPAGLSEIVPHQCFERSRNFFSSAGKGLDVGHRWTGMLKLKTIPNMTHYHLTLQKEAWELVSLATFADKGKRDCSLETLWCSNTLNYSECSFGGVYWCSREPGDWPADLALGRNVLVPLGHQH